MKEYEILKHTEKYQTTGDIDNALIPYFNQHGKWVGDRYGWRHYIWVTAMMRMRNAFLPISRRTRRTRAGTMLLTSFIWKKSSAVLITYCGIEGNVIIRNYSAIRAPNLRIVGGKFIASSNEILYLPYLSRVEGNYLVPNNFQSQAPRLHHVGGDVRIYGSTLPALKHVGGDYRPRWAFDFQTLKLVYVGGSLIPHKCTTMIAPRLENVGRDLCITQPVSTIDLTNLKSVGRHFLTTAYEIKAPALSRVSGSLITHNAENFYNPCIQIGGIYKLHPLAEKKAKLRIAARHAIQCDTSLVI